MCSLRPLKRPTPNAGVVRHGAETRVTEVALNPERKELAEAINNAAVETLKGDRYLDSYRARHAHRRPEQSHPQDVLDH